MSVTIIASRTSKIRLEGVRDEPTKTRNNKVRKTEDFKTMTDFPLVFLTVVLVILNLILVIVTIVYVRHTNRLADDTKNMADIMVREFELRITPILVAYQIPTTRGKDIRIYRPIVSNIGSLPVQIKEVVLEWGQKNPCPHRGSRRPDERYKKNKTVGRILGKGESTYYGECDIAIEKVDMMKDDFEEQKDSDLNQLLGLCQGILYCTYIDINGKEQNTRDLHYWETM